MTHTITAQDGTGDFTSPVAIDGWAPQAESGNVIHRMIEPGTIAVTLVGDLPRTGNLNLVYVTDTDAEAARLLLGRATSFVLDSTDRTVVGMTFVRSGQMTPAVHDTVHRLWFFGVGFQEITP